jgi:type IV secretion system protein VirD4
MTTLAALGLALVGGFGHGSQNLVALTFFAALVIAFGAVWIKDKGGRRTLNPARWLIAPWFWRTWWPYAVLTLILDAAHPESDLFGLLFLLAPIGAVLRMLITRGKLPALVALALRSSRLSKAGRLPTTVSELHTHMAANGGGAYLTTRPNSELLQARPNVAILVLAGPRQGKTSCVIIPAVASHPGPVISTSTKTEVYEETSPIRAELGTCWVADLGGEGLPAGATELRWSPLQRAGDWDQAQMVANAMAQATQGQDGESHWTERAGAVLSCLLHAAAVSGRSMRDVSRWVNRHDLDTPWGELPEGSPAHDLLDGIKRTDAENRSRYLSNVSGVLQAYRSETALRIADDPNFDPDAFVRSTDSLYLLAPGERQRLLAPLVVGLLTEIRQARYRAHRHGHRGAPLLMALDEARNIAPIPDLPQQLSEGGGQGIQTMVVLQSLKQAVAVWKDEGAALLDFVDATICMSGVSDPKTCEAISLKVGHQDRMIQSVGEQTGTAFLTRRETTRTESWTTRREAIVPPDQVARIEFGSALALIGTGWEYVRTIPYDRHPVFTSVLADARRSAVLAIAAAAAAIPQPEVAETTHPDNPWVGL